MFRSVNQSVGGCTDSRRTHGTETGTTTGATLGNAAPVVEVEGGVTVMNDTVCHKTRATATIDQLRRVVVIHHPQ